MMANANARLSDRLRIIWAIAAKDIVDALKNRTIIALVLGMAFMMFSVQILPILLRASGTPRLIAYDAGGSRLVEELENGGLYRVTEANSPQEMERLLLDASGEMLAVVVPAGAEQTRIAAERLEIDGYVTWANRAKAESLSVDLEQHLSKLLGQPVQVHVEGGIVYPPPEGAGGLGMVAGAMVIILMMLGTFLIPYLMFEEKQTHTMEVLLVSPASFGQIVAGKVLVGLFYSIVGMAVVLALNYAPVVRWGPVILATLCGAVLFSAVGLILGLVFEAPQQMGGWVGLPFLIFLLPTLLGMIGTLPEPANSIVKWLPTTALGNVFLASFSGRFARADAILNLALVLVWAIPACAAVVWLLRRSDR